MPITQTEPPGGRPIFARLAEYESYLREKGDTAKYVRYAAKIVLQCVLACGLSEPADLARVDRIRAWLFDDRKRLNYSARTVNYRSRALRGFAAWLVRENHLSPNPLLSLPRLNPAVDRRRVRRAATIEEAQRLLFSTRDQSTTFRGLTGADRAMAYAVAILAGLRVGEIATLMRADVDLGSHPGTIRVRATESKHRREDTLPLHSALEARLRVWMVGRGHDQLWPGAWAHRAARMLRRDLEAAGIPYRDAMGRVLDFHALRYTFVTSLARSGAHPRTTQMLARHSTIELTMSIYTHVDLAEAHAALEKIRIVLP